MTTSIYVASASSDIVRAAEWIDRLTQEGFRITFDWTEAVGKFGSYGEELRDHERRMYARSDLRGVAEANLFWLLSPVEGATVGAWIELGFALAQEKRVLVSPPVNTIFASLPAVRSFKNDEEAFEEICKRVV